MITFRLALERDVPALLAIYAPYIRETAITFEYDVPSEEKFRERFQAITARFPWIVCEEDGRILGYAYGSPAFVRAAYAWNADLSVYLRGDAQGRGLGKALYTRLCTLLQAMGYRTLYAKITDGNRRSLAFHRALGFQEVGRLPNTGYKHGRWHGVVWLQKTYGAFELDPQPPRALSALPEAAVQAVLSTGTVK